MIGLAIFCALIALWAVWSICRAAANGDRLHERAKQARREFRK